MLLDGCGPTLLCIAWVRIPCASERQYEARTGGALLAADAYWRNVW